MENLKEGARSMEQGDIIVGQLQACPVCGSDHTETILDLPAFPLTGILIAAPCETFPAPDLRFLLCGACGHGFLGNIVSPRLLYEQTYDHRTTASSSAKQANDFLWQFVTRLTDGRKVGTALEIGCNDLYFIEKLRRISDHAVGLDPIWRGRQPSETWPNVSILGKFIDELAPHSDLPSAPDLIVSAHTMEHLAEPYAALQSIVPAATADALFVVEVPCLDTQIPNCRFDQIFHQHIQYFTLASALALIERLGCRYVDHCYNYGMWGGTLLFAFSKGAGVSAPVAAKPTAAMVSARYADFRTRYAVYRREIESFDGPIYGFGAAQMLPTMAYHLGRDLDFLSAIFDDSKDRIGRFYPGWQVPILRSDQAGDLASAAILITAIDSYRAIIPRIAELKPRMIFYPLCNF